MTSDEVREARKGLGLTQADVAELLGVDKLTVAAWEQGRRQMPTTAALLLAHVVALAARLDAARSKG